MTACPGQLRDDGVVPTGRSADPPARVVTLVVDEPRGALPPLEVTVPWWQELAPVICEAEAAFGVVVTVVRLLEAVGPFPGGPVTYLVEAPDIDPALLSPTPIGVVADPKRAHYAEVGGPTQLLDWSMRALEDASIEVTGRPAQIRSWNLSALWAIPTSSGRVWLKAVPRFLEHEFAVLENLQATGLVPGLIAGRPGRVLLRDVGGVDAYGLGGDAMRGAVDILLSLQDAADIDSLGSVPRIDAAAFADPLDQLATRSAPSLGADDRARLNVLRDELTDRFRTVASCGEVLVHGDFHGGNLRLRPGGPSTVLDWGDSFVGCPLFDVFALESYRVDGADAIRRHWLERLGVTDEQWAAFRPVAAISLPIVYQRFCDNIERAELVYHQADIMPALEASLSML